MALSRSLAIALGLLVGYYLGRKFGDIYLWVFFCTAFAIAAEASLQTIKNVKAPTKYTGFDQKKPESREKEYRMPKPPEPRF